MKKSPLKFWVRLLLFLCSFALIYVLFVPMWRIDLDAPQYPEGLRLLIYPDHIGGNVDIINGLNHYIGMKTLHSEDFIEFKVLPIIISIFAGLFFIVALINRVKWMNWLCLVFVIFGVVAMADFWRWEYDYGHNLDPSAAIIVPGMAYQPPLIGFKQLLNFGAYSIPDIGGSIFLGVGVILLLCVVVMHRSIKLSSNRTPVITLFLLSTLLLNACTAVPEAINYGKDNCHFCKMTITDHRYGAEILTLKGRVYKYDELSCLISNISDATFDKTSIKEYYITDFCGKHKLTPASECLFLKSSVLRSPMGGNVIAFTSPDSLKLYQTKLDGEVVEWSKLLND
jgi:copper chaperone NosL